MSLKELLSHLPLPLAITNISIPTPDLAATNVLTLFLAIIFSTSSIYLFSTWSRLSYIPGPFLAAFSNLTRMRWVLTGRSHDIHMEMHKKYGDVVRFGPNMVSVSDPTAIPTIYPLTKRGFVKASII
jgi:hypothetical protein